MLASLLSSFLLFCIVFLIADRPQATRLEAGRSPRSTMPPDGLWVLAGVSIAVWPGILLFTQWWQSRGAARRE